MCGGIVLCVCMCGRMAGLGVVGVHCTEQNTQIDLRKDPDRSPEAPVVHLVALHFGPQCLTHA